MKQYSIYVLKCSDNSLYTSSSLEEKDDFLQRHNSGNGEPYTKGRLPVTLFWEHKGIEDKWVASSVAFAIRKLYNYQKFRLFKGDIEILDYVLSEGNKKGPIRVKNFENYLKSIEGRDG